MESWKIQEKIWVKGMLKKICIVLVLGVLGFYALNTKVYAGFWGRVQGVFSQAENSQISEEVEDNQPKLQKIIQDHEDYLFKSSNDFTLGNPNAAIVLVAFIDPYCGHCHLFEKTVDSLLSDRKDVKVVYKMFPILGVDSTEAAREMLAAAHLGEGEKYLKAMWSVSGMGQARRHRLLKKEGMDLKAILKASKSSQIIAQVNQDKDFGVGLGFYATPTFIVYNKKSGKPAQVEVGAMPKAELDDLLDHYK